MLKPQLALEYQWRQKVSVAEAHDNVDITWPSHHADMKRGPAFKACMFTLLPLLRDRAHSVATVLHVMDKIRDAVKLLNHGQVPVITADQPIYAIVKQILWQWPEDYGENQFLIMFRGLHIEMTVAFTRFSSSKTWMDRSSC